MERRRERSEEEKEDPLGSLLKKTRRKVIISKVAKTVENARLRQLEVELTAARDQAIQERNTALDQLEDLQEQYDVLKIQHSSVDKEKIAAQEDVTPLVSALQTQIKKYEEDVERLEAALDQVDIIKEKNVKQLEAINDDLQREIDEYDDTMSDVVKREVRKQYIRQLLSELSVAEIDPLLKYIESQPLEETDKAIGDVHDLLDEEDIRKVKGFINTLVPVGEQHQVRDNRYTKVAKTK